MSQQCAKRLEMSFEGNKGGEGPYRGGGDGDMHGRVGWSQMPRNVTAGMGEACRRLACAQ